MPILDKIIPFSLPSNYQCLDSLPSLSSLTIFFRRFSFLLSFGALWIFPFSSSAYAELSGKQAQERARTVRVNQISCKSVHSKFTRKSWSCTYACKLCFIRNLETTRKSKTKATPLEIILFGRWCVVSFPSVFSFLLSFRLKCFLLVTFTSRASASAQRDFNVDHYCCCCCTSRWYGLVFFSLFSF